jgi:hypothetical protein
MKATKHQDEHAPLSAGVLSLLAPLTYIGAAIAVLVAAYGAVTLPSLERPRTPFVRTSVDQASLPAAHHQEAIVYIVSSQAEADAFVDGGLREASTVLAGGLQDLRLHTLVVPPDSPLAELSVVELAGYLDGARIVDLRPR